MRIGVNNLSSIFDYNYLPDVSIFDKSSSRITNTNNTKKKDIVPSAPRRSKKYTHSRNIVKNTLLRSIRTTSIKNTYPLRRILSTRNDPRLNPVLQAKKNDKLIKKKKRGMFCVGSTQKYNNITAIALSKKIAN